MTNAKSTTQADSKLTQSLRRAKTQKTTANKSTVKKAVTNKKATDKPAATPAPKKTVATDSKIEPIASSERVWPD